MSTLLSVSDLRITFHSRGESNEVVHGIDFAVQPGGQTVAILGESGSGKSVSCMALTQLLPKPPSCSVTGQILFKGKDVLQMDPEAIRHVRGNGIAYIFQEPASSLNPVFTIGYQIAEAVQLHRPDIIDLKARRGGGFMRLAAHHIGDRTETLDAKDKRRHRNQRQRNGGQA